LNHDYIFDEYEECLIEMCEKIKTIRSDQRFPCIGYYCDHSYYVLFSIHFCDNHFLRYLFGMFGLQIRRNIVKKNIKLTTRWGTFDTNLVINVNLLRKLIVEKNPCFFMKMLNHSAGSGNVLGTDSWAREDYYDRFTKRLDINNLCYRYIDSKIKFKMCHEEIREEHERQNVATSVNYRVTRNYYSGTSYAFELYVNYFKGLAVERLKQHAIDTPLTVLDVLETYPLFSENTHINKYTVLDNVSPAFIQFVNEINEYIANENFDAFIKAHNICCDECGNNYKFFYFLNVPYDNGFFHSAPWNDPVPYTRYMPITETRKFNEFLHDFIFGEKQDSLATIGESDFALSATNQFPVPRLRCPHTYNCICKNATQGYVPRYSSCEKVKVQELEI